MSESRCLKKESEDSDSDVEEILVYADVKNTNLQKNLDSSGDLPFRAVGMDTDTPYVQINKYIFKGEYQDCMGTNLFFEERSDPLVSDPMFSEEQKISLDYVCKTNQVLNLNRVFLKTKKDKPTNTKKKMTETQSSENHLLHASSIDEVTKHFMDNLKKCNIVSLVKNDEDISSKK